MPGAMPSRATWALAGLGQLGEHGLDLLGVERAEQAVERADEILPPRRHQHAERRERARHLRDDDLRNENLPRDGDGVQRAGAAESDHRGLARVDALLHRHGAHRERHGGIGDLHDAEGCFLDAEARRAAELLLDGALGRLDVELHRAVEEALGVDPSEHEVGVGDDWIGRAFAIGRRPRIGARALRPDMDAAGRIAPGDRAAAGADLDDVDDRDLHRLAAGFAADHVAVLDRRNAVGDQARLRGGAAHVEADGALDAHQRREPPRRR